MLFKNTFRYLLLLLMSVLIAACGGGSDTGDEVDDPSVVSPARTVDPEDANALSEVLVVPGAVEVEGAMPSTSSGPDAPLISRSEESVAYSPGTQMLLPLDYQATSSSNIASVLFAVVGADQYFRVDVSNTGPSGTLVLPIEIPEEVANGQFCVDVRLIDANGLVSAQQDVCVSVIEPLACDTLKVSGGEGLTNTLHRMGGNAGNVLLEYETFTVKDKIDVFQNGIWIAGTGPYTERTTIRTALDCADATESLGYVGENSEFLFSYDPLLGGDVEVVVSGCENNGTRWEYTASCPGDYGMCTVNSDCSAGEACQSGTCVGEGVLRFSLSWSASADYDLHVRTPDGSLIGFQGNNVADGGELDVDNTTGGAGAVENIFFDETLLSGTYQFFVDKFSGDAGSWTVDVYKEGVLVDSEFGSFSSSDGESSTFSYTYQP